jgi:FMN phosphatase YigB (HAD superfamily)
MMKEKVILTDVDGVLFDWGFAFDSWMKRHGYTIDGEPNNYDMAIRYGMLKKDTQRLIRMFNESAWMRKLPPHRDAIKYVKKLHSDHGFVFHAITSQSNDQYAQHLRIKNLREMFGDSVFDRYVILDCGADKTEALREYEGSECYWIEDKPENAVIGSEFGLDSLLMNHPFSRDFEHSDVRKVSNWKEIYSLITGDY